MRTKDGLEALEEVKILLEYLYMDENNKIVVSNGLTKLEISMDEDFCIYARNLSFPELGTFPYPMVIENFAGCVEQLKDTPPNMEYAGFKSFWEEIKVTTLANLALNKGV